MIDPSNPAQFQIAVTARALVTQDDRLLLVSNDGRIWYTPGGRLQAGESLKDCIRREVYEETGLHVTPGDLIHVFEYWEAEHQRHKVECYFGASLDAGEISEDWEDIDGPVSHIKFFSKADMDNGALVYPEFLRNGRWSAATSSSSEVYLGFER
jgi:ADP-ribose pyrophosphatase YjhB (NUDIX family)